MTLNEKCTVVNPKPAGVPFHYLFCKIRANPFYCPDTCLSSFCSQNAVPKKNQVFRLIIPKQLRLA